MEKLLRTKTDKKQFLKWIEALRSGKYAQGKGALQTEDGYCCLGVACEVIIPKKKQKRDSSKRLKGSFPETPSPKWLIEVNDDYQEKTGKDTLSTLNDEYEETFKQIATKLMKTYRKELKAIA